jgi:predicted RNA-binding Zn ribbon-like protein
MSRLAARTPTAMAVVGRRSLSDLMWVANTRHGPAAHWFARERAGDVDHDHLEDAAATVRYLVDHDVELPATRPTRRHLADLAAISDMVRGLPSSRGGWTAPARDVRARAHFRLDDDGRLAADATGWDAFIADLMLPLAEIVLSSSRLAMCANPSCRLVFIDDSKSHTRRWCDDAGCGNRVRLRRYRRRGAAAPA